MKSFFKNFTKFLRAIASQIGNPSVVYKRIDPLAFPEKPVSEFLIDARLWGLSTQLRTRDETHTLGSLYTLPHPTASQVYKRYVEYNPGNLGDWSREPKTSGTQRVEYEVIHKLIDLYGGNHKTLSGYITSGGTEGNIFSLWLGRSLLEKKLPKEKICLIRTSLSHYSMTKAASVCGVSLFTTPLHPDEWNMDADALGNTVAQLYTKGYRGFILPLTIGYPSTGSSDNIQKITRTVRHLERSYKGTIFYVWIDAALNGLVEPFLNDSFHPFHNPLVQSIVVDFHKFGLVPYPAGVVLYKDTLRSYIERPVSFLSELDATLLGSRSGVPAVSIWAMIHAFGKARYARLARQQVEHKNFVMKEVTKHSNNFRFITYKHSVSFGLIYRGGQLPGWIEQKYSLHPGNTDLLFTPNIRRRELIYKCFFLPHVSDHVVHEFIEDLRSIDQ